MSPPKSPKPPENLPHSMRTRDPWPMWPIALAIFLFVGVYTYINLQYRKEGHAFEPFQAMMDRKNAIVEKNMYDWYGLTTQRAAVPIEIAQPAEATSRQVDNILDETIPEQLKYYMPGKPILLPGSIKTRSPSTLRPGVRLPIQLEVPLALAEDQRLQLLAFYKDGDLYLLPTLFVEKIDDIDPSAFEGPVATASFTLPTDPIAAESVNARFLSSDRLVQWQIRNLDPAAAVVEETEEPTP